MGIVLHRNPPAVFAQMYRVNSKNIIVIRTLNMRLEVEAMSAPTHDGGYPKLSARSVPIHTNRILMPFFDLNFTSVISLRTLTLRWSIALKVWWRLICRHSLFHLESVEHKLIATVISGKSIYFLLRDGDPSLRIFLSC